MTDKKQMTASEMGKESWKKRKVKHDSKYFSELGKKSAKARKAKKKALLDKKVTNRRNKKEDLQ